MADNTLPRASISVEETYTYEARLGVASEVNWQAASGQVRIQIPYDGMRAGHIAPAAASHPLGELRLTFPNTNDPPLVLPVALPAGPALPDRIRSGQRAVLGADYDPPSPAQTLVVLDGEVFDQDGKELAIQGLDPFRNPLCLALSLWIPDLWRQSKADESHEVAVLLMQGEDQTRILLPYAEAVAADGRKLAQSLAALANAAGGSIFIGVGPDRQAHGLPDDTSDGRRRLETRLLLAALRCSPPVRCSPPRYVTLDAPAGKTLARLDVPAAAPILHALEGVIYRREGRVVTQASGAGHPAASPPPLAAADAYADITDEEGRPRFRNTPDQIVRSAAGGLDGLDLGRQICGLLNSNVGHGRIVLENLPARGGGVPWLGRQTPVSQQLENLLAREAGRLTPPPVLPAPQFIQVRDAQLAIITVPKTTAPVTLYHEAAYVWDGAALTRLDPRAALRRYLTYAGFPDEIEPGAGAVHLEYARLARPIAPPATLGQPTDVQRAADDEAAGLQARVHAIGRYESQLYAQVWTSTAFQRQPQTGGFALKLTLPLQQMALALDAAGQLTMNEPLIVEGEIGVMLDGLLASGIGVTRQAVAGTQNADGGSAWLDQLPILKQTRLRVRYRADLRDLFRQRTRTTVLDFYLPDVSLDGERVQDILQACADLGFRIAEVDGPRADPNDATVNQAVIRGVRSEGYADIHLFLLAQCRRRPITRQLRFAGQRFDSKETQSALLNVTAAFWATASGNPYPVTVPRANVGPDEERVAASDEVARAMAQIQIALHELLSQRFQHLRTE